MDPAPEDVRSLLAAHAAAEEGRLEHIEASLRAIASRDSSPPSRAERDVGRAGAHGLTP